MYMYAVDLCSVRILQVSRHTWLYRLGDNFKTCFGGLAQPFFPLLGLASCTAPEFSSLGETVVALACLAKHTMEAALFRFVAVGPFLVR